MNRMHTTLQDLRYALRMLLRTPGFTLVAVLTLALGIGANTAIFTVVNALLLKPLPYAQPERLVMVWQDYRARGGPADEWATPGNYIDWRAQKDLFEQVAVISGWGPTMTGGAEPEPLRGEQVTHEYFGVLGINLAFGRDFRQEDAVPNAARVAIIGDDLWKRRFGGDPAVIGRTVTLSGESHEIIGVLPGGFRPIVSGTAEIWRPLRIDPANPSRGADHASRGGAAPERTATRPRAGGRVRAREAAGSDASATQREGRLHPDAAARARRR